MSDDNQEVSSEERYQNKVIHALLAQGQIAEGQLLTFKYKRNTFECAVREDAQLVYKDEEMEEEQVFYSLNSFANWCTLHRCDDTIRGRNRTNDAHFFSFQNFYVDGRRLADMTDGLEGLQDGNTSEENATGIGFKRRAPDRGKSETDEHAKKKRLDTPFLTDKTERAGKTRSDRQRASDEKRDAAAAAVEEGRRNTRLASGSIKQVDYKLSAIGSFAKPTGESDEESVGREAGAGILEGEAGESAENAKKDLDKDTASVSRLEGYTRTGRRLSSSRLRKVGRGQTGEEDVAKLQTASNVDEREEENQAEEINGDANENEPAPEAEDEEPVKKEEDKMDVGDVANENTINLKDDVGLLDLEDDAADSEEHSDDKSTSEGSVVSFGSKQALLQAIKVSNSLETDAVVKASGTELHAEDVEKALAETKSQMQSVYTTAEDSPPSAVEVIAFLAARVYHGEKHKQETILKRTKSEQEMERNADRVQKAYDALTKERDELEWKKIVARKEIDEIRDRLEYEAKNIKQLEKERLVVEAEANEAKERAENQAKRRSDLELEVESMRLRELEARRRLDRANLKTAALRADITANTTDTVVDKESRVLYNISQPSDEARNLDLLRIKRKQLETLANKKEVEALQMLRRVEMLDRKNDQLFVEKNRLENDIYAGPKASSNQAYGKTQPNKPEKKPKKSTGKEDAASKKDKQNKANNEQGKDRENSKKKSQKSAQAVTTAKDKTNPAGSKTSEAPFVSSKRKHKPIHSLPDLTTPT
uniref:Uncharacterized protein n=1 Tax=Rhodosorus marinus TaxID=101924 RepID=A0A7S3A831_9RHOD|mmetsp:Transcript_6714/g.28728  ORF Transcript_6714/g.28728 Transcript_6714/m.28728 type:complete len:766 (+) Transcript_6714:341-2638(+)|eukprot:CAMPEP_0113961540 /NCGR_PEP_ID=MMETSP0011_2-20120614/5367_1 /TAXON_ID=101924 /ORGANISM="Rhodosorus marinus" /LENGTH=765 /DNA_ID=CAMNT_0000973195 /DNA_START=209 /DNA_END=2506 /DNA_ORIENTATION=- /assembly_acc=CAM_ASM_000156